MRSQTKHTSSLGCAIAAALAEGIDLVDFSPQNRSYSVKVHHDTYLPTSTAEDRKTRIKKWKMAVERSYGWATSTKSTAMTSEWKYWPHNRVCCANFETVCVNSTYSLIHLLIRIKRCRANITTLSSFSSFLQTSATQCCLRFLSPPTSSPRSSFWPCQKCQNRREIYENSFRGVIGN